MRSQFSKPLADIAALTNAEIAGNAANLHVQRTAAQILQRQPRRLRCLLCDAELASGEEFVHRDVAFLRCHHCGHLQSAARPPAQGFPPTEFSRVYPALDHEAAAARTAAVYQPKLEWMLAQADLVQSDRAGLLSRRWFEIGSGAGYFLRALENAGARDAYGVEHDTELVARACEWLGRECVVPSTKSFATTIQDHRAEIYVAWFVLEHVEDAGEAWRAFRDCPTGTLVAFSVPMFGLATLIESMSLNVAARSLDGAVHVQLYTERSLSWAMEAAGLEPIAEWLFGQDVEDLLRALALHTSEAAGSLARSTLKTLGTTADALQATIDRARLCDARHVLARRR